jgi:hypothetical protein
MKGYRTLIASAITIIAGAIAMVDDPTDWRAVALTVAGALFTWLRTLTDGPVPFKR